MLKIYNTLTRKKEVFKPIKDKQVGMYVCGPTVYDSGHLGHARTYVAFDVVRRWLEISGYKVKFISNITDVHDDVIKKAKKEKTSIKEISDKFTNEFFADIKKLKIEEADGYPRVSEYIPQIINFIETLVKKGFAYEKGGSVYFAVSKFKGYGKLSRRKLEKAKAGARVDIDKYDKKEAADFALWKKTNPEEEKAGAGWNSPWGKGRPGWHIECSVMAKETLGDQIDIHAGAKDLIFPHHENEIAQSEAASAKSPFVRYWLHSGLLTINGQKMSKSLGNFIAIKDALAKYAPETIRLWVLNAHYRSLLDYSEKALQSAKAKLARIDDFIIRLNGLAGRPSDKAENDEVAQIVKISDNLIEEAMDNDFNTPRALAEIFNLLKQANKLADENKLGKKEAEKILGVVLKYGDLFFGERKEGKKIIKESVTKIIKEYDKARKEKDYSKSDNLRKLIEKEGFIVRDTAKGTIVIPDSRKG